MPSWTATAAGLLEAVAAEPVAPHDGARAEPVTVPGADAAAALLPKGPASHGVRPRPNCHGDRDRNRCLGRGLPLVERSRPPVPSLAAPQAPPPQALELVSSSWALGLVVRYGASGSLVERSWRSRGRSTKRCGSGSSRCCQSIGPARAARSHSATGPELGFGSGVTCWRRFRRWCEAGVWDRLHRMLLSELHALGEIDWSAVCLDGSHVRAKKGAPERARHR